ESIFPAPTDCTLRSLVCEMFRIGAREPLRKENRRGAAWRPESSLSEADIRVRLRLLSPGRPWQRSLRSLLRRCQPHLKFAAHSADRGEACLHIRLVVIRVQG